MAHPPQHLASHPLPPGIAGALALGGYQLLADVAGVGAGRLGSQAFLLVAPDPDPALAQAGTQISLHHRRIREDAEAAAFSQLAAQLGYLRLSGYRLAPERVGLRSKIKVVDPATGAVVATIPEKHPSGMLSLRAANTAARLLAATRALPPAGAPPDLQDPERLHQLLLALALRDESVGGAEAAELVDRALALTRGDQALDPSAALEAARRGYR